jgi:RNA polymerase sigma-70 factor (ECF subfamily)
MPSGRAEASAQDELCRLMGAYEVSLLSFTRSLIRDADLALDCVQETFLRAYESLGRGRQVNKRWLFTVAHSRVMDEFRRRRRLQPELDDDTVTSCDASTDTGMIVRQALDRLPRQHQEVLYLFVVAGFTTDEIAGLLGTTGPAVRQRLYRARQKFRQVYGGSAYDS